MTKFDVISIGMFYTGLINLLCWYWYSALCKRLDAYRKEEIKKMDEKLIEQFVEIGRMHGINESRLSASERIRRYRARKDELRGKEISGVWLNEAADFDQGVYNAKPQQPK